MVERRLCRFERDTFDARGREIRRRLKPPRRPRLLSKKIYVSLDITFRRPYNALESAP